MSVPINPRQILSHLNELGYRNITPEQLKEFLKDLKKLIKYDTQNNENIQENYAIQSTDPFERLYHKSTISYNAKTLRIGMPASSASTKPRTLTTENESSRPVISHRSEEKEVLIDRRESPLVAPPSVIISTSPPEKISKEPPIKDKTTKMWIRTKSACNNRRPLSAKPNDPVSLYHAYQRDWEKFKPQLPGENDHSELRWKIRTKLLGGES